ncbi:isohexenylglutaconyl-CoA hydratase [Gordonia spumicola]|uniref:Isohexenylglutaconyl-CoA hydratase n=1 Tax=Gordonia spumicola TaxID=589161 RepID=A0A7I9V2E3_9ACTN|nr:enoyl-CoA hydratase-related protein [Gordonia spumicola]GED99587.1 isohexenylglutaconyl-CoA hydratase [Gordonia spumicola]
MSAVVVDDADGVLTVTIDRPDQRNALSQEVVAALHSAIDTARSEFPRIRALVLRGAGGAFCAGGDLKEFQSVFQDSPGRRAEIAQANRRGGELFAGLADLPCVVIAAVDGPAIGGGFGLAAATDITIATRRSVFAMSETNLGLLPAQIAPFVAARIGVHHARRLAVTASRFKADEAYRIGLVDDVVDDAAALGHAVTECTSRVLRCAPNANAAIKRLLADLPGTSRDHLLDGAADAFAEAMLGTEARAGIRAFLDGTVPPWTVAR